MLKEQWARDLESEKEEKESILNANKQVYKDIEDFNRREEIVRTYRSKIEKTVRTILIFRPIKFLLMPYLKRKMPWMIMKEKKKKERNLNLYKIKSIWSIL